MSRRAKWTLGIALVVVVGGGLTALTAAKRGNAATEVRLEAIEARDLVAAGHRVTGVTHSARGRAILDGLGARAGDAGDAPGCTSLGALLLTPSPGVPA